MRFKHKSVYPVVEVTGLEPTTPWSLTMCATKLRYTSKSLLIHYNEIYAKCQEFAIETYENILYKYSLFMADGNNKFIYKLFSFVLVF